LVRSGHASVQDEGAQLVAPLLEPQAGGLYIDLAAAPGGKTGHLAELAGPTARILAIDASRARIERLRGNATRLECDHIFAAVADARHLRAVAADGVLLDAPCTGLGVLARRPDLRWRKRSDDLERLPQLQVALLDQAARLVRPGGLLVYSVCSFEPEETIAVAHDFAARHPGMRFESVAEHAALQVEPGLLYWLPQRHGVDGGFAARWRRAESN
jgi:16S rRNA (cytosine967-C5)-methyltransferase